MTTPLRNAPNAMQKAPVTGDSSDDESRPLNGGMFDDVF
jgi:hypothetical protein